MIHPVMAHFAVVLPIVSLVFIVLYAIKPSEIMSKISSRVLAFAAIFMVLAWYSGGVEGKEAYPLLTSEASKILIAHKTLGLYLAIALGITAIIKLIACRIKNFKMELLSLVLLIGVVGTTLYQGKMGGSLVYEHGANVTNHSDGLDAIEELKELEDDEEDEDEEED